MQAQTIAISDILVTDRQRQDLGDLDRDFSSIKEIGLIQPIVLDMVKDFDTANKAAPNYKLKVGGRRLAWLKANGFTELYHGISCDPKRPGYILSVEVDERQRQEAELIENINRKRLHWREECIGIARVHRQRWIENKSKALEWSQKHTARLLNIDGYAKIGYALIIADELRDNPESELGKCENYAGAVKIIMELAEREARAEQEKRREILRKIEERQQPQLPFVEGEQPQPVVHEDDKPPERETIWLSNLLRHGDFSTIASEEFPEDMYPCALVFHDDIEWREQTIRLLKHDSYLIMMEYAEEVDETVIWNQLDLLPEDCAFRDSTYTIGIKYKGSPRPYVPSPTNVVSANPEDGSKYPPAAVLDFLLRATTLPGQTILCPTGAPVGMILELGRRPLTFEPDLATHERNMEEAKAYYNNLYLGQVDFK